MLARVQEAHSRRRIYGCRRSLKNRLRVLVDSGTDPRDLRREQAAAAEARKAAETAKEILVREAWNAYLEERRHLWGEDH